MFCTRCGKELKEGMVFCPGCGSPVPAMNKIQEQTINENAAASAVMETVPVMPVVPMTQETPVPEAAPVMQEAPVMAETTAAPEAPATETVPVVPEVTVAPEVPVAEAAPVVPEASAVEAVPVVPEAPAAPEAPAMPVAPVTQETTPAETKKKIKEEKKAEKEAEKEAAKKAKAEKKGKPDKKEKTAKKGKAGLVVGIVCGSVLVLAAAGFGAWWFLTSRPSYKVGKAMDAEKIEDMDLDTVTELYDELSDEDKENTRASLIDSLTEAEDRYYNGKLERKDYEQYVGELEGILGEESSFAVIKDNLNGVIGTWSGDFDMGSKMAEKIGYGIELSVPVTWTLTFDEDGELTSELTYDSYQFFEQYYNYFYDYYMDEYIGWGLDEAKVDKLFMKNYGYTYKDYFDQYFNYDDFMSQLGSDDMVSTCTYTYRDGIITVDGETLDADVNTNLEIITVNSFGDFTDSFTGNYASLPVSVGKLK